MEQNETIIEKQELMERIKSTFDDQIWPKNRWWRLVETFIFALWPFFLFFDEITEGGFGIKQLIYLVFGILYAVLLIGSEYRNVFWNKRVQQAETAQDLLETINRSERENRELFGSLLLVIAAFVLSLFILDHEIVWAIVVGVLVVLIVLLMFVKHRQSKDIKRLRELVEQE